LDLIDLEALRPGSKEALTAECEQRLSSHDGLRTKPRDSSQKGAPKRKIHELVSLLVPFAKDGRFLVASTCCVPEDDDADESPG
jgi:hypothetical protein